MALWALPIALLLGTLFFAGLAHRFARHQLFTHEDPFNVHKIIGFPCLAHFIYRFVNLGPHDMFFDDSLTTLALILMHAALSMSSMVFKIPVKRIKEGSRIWPEYRLHSITFAYRSLACMLLVWLEGRFQVEQPLYFVNIVIVLCTMAAADAGSFWVGDNHSSTIRDLSAPPWLTLLFSYGQFIATTNCLVGQRRYSLQFSYVWLIQVTAFLMTLRRKNLAPHTPLVFTYGGMLLAVLLVAAHELWIFGTIAMPLALANFAAIGRMGFGFNKYALWSVMATAVHFSRQTVGTRFAWVWVPTFWLSCVVVLIIGKRKLDRKTKPVKPPPGATPIPSVAGG